VQKTWRLFPKGERSFILRSDTTVSVRSKSLIPAVKGLFEMLDATGVPELMSTGLSRIYFSQICSYFGEDVYGFWRGAPRSDISVQIDEHGDVPRNRSRVSSNVVRPIHTLVHELGHHIDYRDGLTSRHIVEEKVRVSHRFHRHATKNVAEYIAFGFENFYFENIMSKSKMRTLMPRLFKLISQTHDRLSLANEVQVTLRSRKPI